MLPYNPLEILDYIDRNGDNPYGKWFDSLSGQAAAKVAIAVKRLALGNISNVKSVGGGIAECKIDFGPGYRVYFGRDGMRVVILLGGGSKQRQQNDIRLAQVRWADYKLRKG